MSYLLFALHEKKGCVGSCWRLARLHTALEVLHDITGR